MSKNVLEVGFKENSSCGVRLVADVGGCVGPSVVILENIVTHCKEQGFKHIQLLSILVSSPIAESLRVNRGRFSDFGGIMGSHHGQGSVGCGWFLLELNIEQVDEDIDVVGRNHNKTKNEIVAESFHDSDNHFAADRYSAVDNFKNHENVLGE